MRPRARWSRPGPTPGFRVGEQVFVPGANCFTGDVHGPVRRRLAPSGDQGRAGRADRRRRLAPKGALLALAATARHALAGFDTALPDLIVGHGTLGRLLARLTVAAGAPAPTVWEIDPARARRRRRLRRSSPPKTIRAATTARSTTPRARRACSTSWSCRIAKGGEIVLAGFYTEPVAFAFPPAFMKEARIRIAAEWAPDDLVATRALIESGALSLAGLITHRRPAAEARRGLRDRLHRPGLPENDPRLEGPRMTLTFRT